MSNAEDQRNLPPDKGEHDKDLKFSRHIDQGSAMTTCTVEETKHEVGPKNLGFQIGQTNRELNNDKKSYEAEIESPMEITMKCPVYTLFNSPETMELEGKKVYDKNNKIVPHPRKRTKTNKDYTDYSSRGESSALESEKQRSEISELDEGGSIKGVKSPINSPNSKKNRNRSLKNTPEIDTARNRRRALQQNILHFPKFPNFVSAYDRDSEYSSGGDNTLTPSQMKNTPLNLGETSPQSQDIPPQTLIIEAQIIQNEAAENPKSTKPEQNTASSEPPLDEKTAGIIED
ncbi:hypothetical protein JTB14_013753 [Gonioctena quinquepunctata]|nr:hypothetical protein JTB14_013753 [Gonioctena quinquepunctata]